MGIPPIRWRRLFLVGLALPLLVGWVLLLIEYDVLLDRPAVTHAQPNDLTALLQPTERLSKGSVRDAGYERIVFAALEQNELSFANSVVVQIGSQVVRDRAHEAIARKALSTGRFAEATLSVDRISEVDRRNTLYREILEARLSGR